MVDIASGCVAAEQDRPVREGLRARWRLWVRRVREREQLARLSPRELRDFGLSPSQAAYEAAKPFWRA